MDTTWYATKSTEQYCDKYTKIDYVLQVLQFISIKRRLYYSVCVFIYKVFNNMLPVSLGNKFVIIGNERQRLTRQAGNIVLASGRSGEHKRACFMKELKCTIPYQSGQSNVIDI